MAGDDAAVWFGGDDPRTEDETRFLARLREHAGGWAARGVVPGDTWCLASMVPLLVVVPHPSLQGRRGLTTLQVGFLPPESGSQRLLGEWGSDYLLDAGGDDTDLSVEGVAGPAELFADLAASWVDTQLGQAMELLEWRRRDRVVASRIRLTDPGKVLVSEGPWRRTRRAPDRRVRLW